MNYKEFNEQKELVLTTQKKGVLLYEWKNIWKSLLGEKYLLGKPVHFSVKNTTNNANTRGFIQQFFRHLYRDNKFNCTPHSPSQNITNSLI